MMMSRTTLLVFALVCLAAPPPAAPGASGVVLDDDGRQGGLLGTPLGQLVPDVRVSKTGGTGAGVATVVATIGEALKLSNNRKPGALHFVIHVTEDTYHEHLVITSEDKYIVMIGDGIGRTVITGNLSDRTGDDVKKSATMTVYGEGFMARDLTVENTAGDQNVHQAVALLVEANKTVFYRCQLKGYQDTLMASLHLQFYRDCEISGTVDFIFGDATAVFQNCILYARRPSPGHDVVITAQGREKHDGGSGFLLQNCNITTAPGESLQGVLTYLGRPWKHHARVVFMLCSIDDIVHADGWVAWDKQNPGQIVKGGFPIGHEDHIFYGEYGNHGAGANLDHRVDWHGFYRLSEAQARSFAPRKFIHGGEWLPQTGVPYYLGLRPSH